MLAMAVSLSLLPAAPGVAQDAVILPVTPNSEYQAAIRFRNIQSEMFHVDRGFDGVDMDQMPGPAIEAEAQDDAPRSVPDRLVENLNLLFLAALAGVIGFLAYKYGGRARDGFARGDNGKRAARRTPQTEEQRQIKRARTQELIARLLDMEDREAAMVELIHHVLDAAAVQHELRLGRSETARDFLRRLPQDWHHLADMRRIVIAEELVQFGGRPLITRTFEDCLRRATPILDGARA